MAEEFRLEDPGEGIHEAEIKEINVAEGDEVADGDIILTIETDKAAVEVPAPFAGIIEEIRVEVGDIAEIGDVIMTYREPGESEARKEEQEDRSEGEDREGDGHDGQTKKKHKPKEERQSAGEPEPKEDRKQRSQDREGAARTEEPRDESAKTRKQGPVPASPATRRLARELGIDLESVEASGPDDRVTAEDVRSAAGKDSEERKKEDRESRPAKAQERARPDTTSQRSDFEKWGEVERVPLRSIRRTIAERMALSWSRIPHVMHQDEVDITELEQWRKGHKTAVEEQGGKLTLTVLVMKAVVAALKEFPRFNASLDLDKNEIVLKRYYHLGLAVDTEDGLVVPVVRDVDRKSIAELADEIMRLADKARDGKLVREELQGASFTITNPGPLGGRVLTPIIDYPQAAILGLGRTRLDPKVRGDPDEFEIVPRLMLPLCLAFDHRLNDGADAARLVTMLGDTLSNTESILLNV